MFGSKAKKITQLEIDKTALKNALRRVKDENESNITLLTAAQQNIKGLEADLHTAQAENDEWNIQYNDLAKKTKKKKVVRKR